MFITSDIFGPTKAIQHGFFTRLGGVSHDCFGRLNCGYQSGDTYENVDENRQRVAEILGADTKKKLLTVRQVHGNKVVTLTKAMCNQAWSNPEADALVTKQLGIAIGVLTADCLPVLFYEPEAKVIGAAHAGWRGLLGGVLENTIIAMVALGACPKQLRVAIGPSIFQQNYEVDQMFYDKHLEKDSDAQSFFLNGDRNGKYLFDLQGYAQYRLQRQGVEKIDCIERDTFAEPEIFFSSRYQVPRATGQFGRQISAICL